MTALARTLVVMVIVMAGCGGNPAMSVPDGMAMLAATDASGAPLTSIDVPPTLVGQAASVGVVVHNTGTAETGAISISIGGANAGDLAIDDARTTCAATSLAPGATCMIELVFHAAAAGDRTASLTIASPAGGTLELGITAHGGMPDLQLAASVELGNVEVGSVAQVPVVLRNAGAFSAPIDAITVSSTGVSAGVFSLGATTCGASLGAHSMCTIDVVASPHDMAPFPFAGTLVVTSHGVDHTAALTARGAHRVKVLKAGTVSGTVTLTDAGPAPPMSVTCGDTCEILTPDAILLTQTPDPDAEFLGWSLPDDGGECGVNPTCAVNKELTPTTVTATWVPAGSTQLHIAIVGGSGGIRIVSRGVTTTCVGECTTFVSPGPVMLTVEGTAPAIGYSGACTSSGTQCTYTQGVGLSDVTVTLDNPNAVWTYLPGNGTDVRSAAFDGSGNLIITTGAGMTKLSPQGAPIWTQPIAAVAVATGPVDTIYAITETSLIKLDLAGTMLWSAPWANGCVGGDASSFSNCLAVSSTGAAAINSGGVVARWESDGTASWTRPGSGGGVGFDALGDVVIPTHAGTLDDPPLDAQPYAPDGTQLPLITSIAPVSRHYALACDSGGTIHVVANDTLTGFVGIAVAGPGQESTALFFTTGGGGWDVGRVALPFSTGIFAENMALSTTGRLAAVGTFMLSGNPIYRGGWVQIYGP